MGKLVSQQLIPLQIAVLTVSDTRTETTDTSGQTLVASLQREGHTLHGKALVPDNIYQIRAQISQWIADPQVQAILVTGGTGFTARDNTPEAVKPLLDKFVEGFGELFRTASMPDIGTSTIQSRAIAGLANRTIIFCLPGSPNACKTGWDTIIKQQIDSRHGPCNFVPHLKNITLNQFTC